MLQEKNIEKLYRNSSNEYCFSCISGYNYYAVPIKEKKKDDFFSFHVTSKNLVKISKASKIDSSLIENDFKNFLVMLMHPIKCSDFEWPVDLVQLEVENGIFMYFYVFMGKVKRDFVPIRTLFYQDRMSKVLDWRNTNIQKICINVLKAISYLHERDYSFNNFDINMIYYNEKTSGVYFKFHSEIRNRIMYNAPVNIENIALEFLPPYLFGEKKYSGNIDEYSICSLLFYLMIGRLPYDGKGLSNYGNVFNPFLDVDRAYHLYYLEHYHMFSYFIFDPDNNVNHLSLSSENSLPIERWNALPLKVKHMFNKTFIGAREKKMSLYCIKDWLECLLNCFGIE